MYLNFIICILLITFLLRQFVIGRSKSCSIIIEEIYISRRHCVIRYEEGQFFIVNYVSKFVYLRIMYVFVHI